MALCSEAWILRTMSYINETHCRVWRWMLNAKQRSWRDFPCGLSMDSDMMASSLSANWKPP